MKISALIISAIAMIMATAAVTTAKADTVYNFSGLKFDDGTTINGQFSINVYGFLDAGYSATTVTGSIGGYSYDDSINASFTPGGTSITFNRTGYDGFLVLTYDHPLTGFGADTLITGAGGPSYECDTFSCSGPSADVRYLATPASGPAPSISAAPEPAAWGLMLLGVGVAGAGLRLARRKTSLAAA